MFIAKRTDEIMFKTKSGNRLYWMIPAEKGALGFELRYVEIPPGGRSSAGSHVHEHEVFIVTGRGKAVGRYANGNSFDEELVPGMAVFVAGGEDHQWVNNSDDEPLGFVCVVPRGAEGAFKPPSLKQG